MPLLRIMHLRDVLSGQGTTRFFADVLGTFHALLCGSSRVGFCRLLDRLLHELDGPDNSSTSSPSPRDEIQAERHVWHTPHQVELN